MNSGIAISFVIGGLLLISILTLNARVVENSGETTLNMSAKTTVATVTQIMTRDFLRIGYNTAGEPNAAIKSISDHKIMFMADLNNDDDDDPSPVNITWEANPGDKVTSTENPNDYTLTRTVSSGPEQGTTTFAVTNFTFTYLDDQGNTTNNTGAVKLIKVSMECEAPGNYGGQGYEKSVWNKTFTPPNLNLGAYNNTGN